MASGKAPAPKLERVGKCGGVGSWLPPGARRRVPWRCKCTSWSEQASYVAREATCVCGHTRGVHALVEAQP